MKAKVTVAAFFVQCPKCNTDIEAVSGSLMWAVNEPALTKFDCIQCGTALELPAKYASLLAE